MKESGIIRRTDELCRVVIPKEMRDKLHIDTHGYVVIYLKGKEIIVSKYDDSCAFCGKKVSLKEYKDKLVCKKCLSELKKKFV